MSKAKFAKIVFKKLKEGIPGGPRKGQKAASHGIYDGKRYELDELTPVKARGEKGNFSFHRDKFIPRVVLADKPIVNKKLKTSLTDEAIDKNKYIMDTLESMPDKQLFRLTTKEMDEMFGRNVSSQRKRVLAKRIDPATGEYYKPFEMGLSAFGRHFKKYDEFDNPITVERKLKADLGLKEKNFKKIMKLFNDIDSLSESKTPINSKASLFLQINRAIKNSELPEDKTIENILKQVDKSAWGKMLKERNIRAANIKRGEKIGILTKDDRPEISHIIPVKNDLSKALDIENVFYEPQKINRARPRGEVAQRRDDYLQELDKIMINYDLMDKYSLSKGGLIKKGLQKIIDNTKFDPSRRKFLKQAGATAASAAMPVGKLTPTLAQAATKTATRFAPPWIKSMVGILDSLSTKSGVMSHTMANGTKIKSLGGTADTYSGKVTPFEITNSDGYKVPVNMIKNKKGDIQIEFDIRDDFSNNQHIYIDKKTGQVEIVDENYYMTSPEDFAKDDPITWDVTTPSQMQAFERKMGIMRGDGSEMMKDFASLPEDGDYSELFESFIDSFSPSGNIFNTKAKAKQIAKEQKRLKNLRDERMEADFESQFRGGNIHGFRRGGTSMRDYPRTAIKDMDRLVDAVGMAETNPAYMQKHNLGERRLYVSPTGHVGTYGIGRATALDPGYYQYGATRFEDFDKNKFDEAKQREFSKNYLTGMIGYYTANPDKMIYGNDPVYEAITRYGPIDTRKTGDYYDKVISFYNKGGLAENVTHDDVVAYIRKNPQEYVGGGLVKKLAPKVIGKLREYSPKITGPKKQGPIRPDRPFTVFDEAGLPIKDFDTEKAARNFLRDDARAGGSADMYTIGTSYSKNARMPGDDTAGAMFWGSREKLIDAPMESAKGSEWLAYLKRPFAKHNPIKDMELNDTQLSTHLSRNANKTLSKADVIKDFDEKLAPDIDVVVLGGGSRETSKSLRNILRTDLQAFRPGPLRNVLGDLQLRINPLAEAVGNNDKQSILKIVGQVEDSVQKNFGVPNAITEGFPQKFPFELKEPLQEIAQLSGVRLAGFKEYARETIYSGQQTLSGGKNYREFLFKYSHKPGSLRNTEPTYTYAHDFGLRSSQRANGFVHMRTSDRTDQFGRRILHIEEIQSDMHQPINAAGRRVKKYQADQAARGEPLSETRAYKDDVQRSKYAPRGDLVKEVDNANEQQMMLIQAKIEDLLQLPQTQQTQVRLARLNRERAKIRKIIADKRAKAGEGDHSGVPQGPYSKTEDYNEFVMKYALRTAQEGGYDGISISTPQIKNLSTSQGSRDHIGNITAYGPIAQGAMKKVGKKSGAKFIKTVITDERNRPFEVPLLLLKDNPQAQSIISKGLGAYKRGGIAING